ncbi:MAG TPA: hypothetical protein VNU95_04560 [Candidatus Acidoferrales bacterium]|jgi:hypothetical protein|nr:hypothetical protein [Candidatus Acidoferrales bacterium]
MSHWTRFTLLRGKLEMIEKDYVFVIPLAAGGEEFIKCTAGISKIEGENLIITLPEMMVAAAGFHNGSWVDIDNRNGVFTFDAAKLPEEPGEDPNRWKLKVSS